MSPQSPSSSSLPARGPDSSRRGGKYPKVGSSSRNSDKASPRRLMQRSNSESASMNCVRLPGKRARGRSARSTCRAECWLRSERLIACARLPSFQSDQAFDDLAVSLRFGLNFGHQAQRPAVCALAIWPASTKTRPRGIGSSRAWLFSRACPRQRSPDPSGGSAGALGKRRELRRGPVALFRRQISGGASLENLTASAKAAFIHREVRQTRRSVRRAQGIDRSSFGYVSAPALVGPDPAARMPAPARRTLRGFLSAAPLFRRPGKSPA